jgi:hypothetical protein
MSEVELSFEERNHLWMLCGVSFLVVSFSFLVWFFFFDQNKFPLSGWDVFVRAGIPYSIIGPTSWFLAYEVFYPRRVRKSHMFHLKRFARRTLSLLAVILSFFGVTSFSQVSFSRTLGSEAIYPGMVLFVFVFIVAVLLWLRRHNSSSPKW